MKMLVLEVRIGFQFFGVEIKIDFQRSSVGIGIEIAQWKFSKLASNSESEFRLLPVLNLFENLYIVTGR